MPYVLLNVRAVERHIFLLRTINAVKFRIAVNYFNMFIVG